MDFSDTDTTVPSILPEDHKPPRRKEVPKTHLLLKVLFLGVLLLTLYFLVKR
jgi:hypothetical protein